MRALFSFSFAIDGTVFELKTLPTTDESVVEVKRTTAFKDAVSGQVSQYATGGKTSPEAKVEAAKISRVSVSNLTGEVVSDTQTVKGIWRDDNEFVEVSDADLAALRLSNGEFRVLGKADIDDVIFKGATMRVVPTKSTKEARARYVSLMRSVADTALFIEGSVRNKQRLYVLSSYYGTMTLDEVAYKDEEDTFESVDEVPEEELAAAEPIDLSGLPLIEETPYSSFVAAFNEKYGVQNG